MFRRSVSLKSAGGLVVRVTMANNKQDLQSQKTEYEYKAAATKPETPKGSVIPEGEQKAFKKGPYISVDDDEGAPNGETEDEEDVRIEEEWTTVSITSVEESQSAVEYILEHKQDEPVSIICCGEKQGDADGKITLLVISMRNKSWIYQLCNIKGDVMVAGKLKHLFFDTDLMKVFHDVTWQSAVLFNQYEIVLNGTKVFDSKVVCQMKLLDDKTIDILRLEGFMPSRWVEEDGKIDRSKWTEISLDQELINKLVERCKALLQFYKMFTRQKVAQPKKQICAEVNKYIDKKRSDAIKKNFKSQAEKNPSQPTLSSKEQRKGPGLPEKGKKNKATRATEDEEVVRIEEEWTTVSITSVEESQSAVVYILDHKQDEPVSIICCGEKQGDADGKITLLVISMQNKSWIYQLCNMKEDLMETGKLKQLFFDTDLMKVFHDVTWQSAVLFNQYEIVLNGTKVFDSKVVCQMKLLDDKTIDILRLEGFMPSRWVEEDGKIDRSKWTEISLDQELINKLVERCKALLQFYKMFTRQKVAQPKKQICAEVNKYIDKKRSDAIKKNFKSQAEKNPSQPTLSSKEQRKGPGLPEKGKKNKATRATEDEEVVRIEEEWITVSITNVEDSQSAVEYILEHKQKEPVSIICCGEKKGDADGRITLLVISMQNKSWIYQLCNMTEDLMEAGKLKQLFFDTDLMKVFHDVTWQSAVLFKQYEIVLDGTKVFDSKVVCQLKLLDDKTIDILRLEGFMPSRWVEEDGKIDSSKWTEISLDQELINKLVERCKALLQFYKMFTRQKVPQPKKQIYDEVNKYVDKKRSKEIKKIY